MSHEKHSSVQLARPALRVLIKSVFVLLGLEIFGGLSGSSLAAPLPSWLTERRILGENNLEPIENAKDTPIYEWATAVARVETRSDQFGFCTAFRVSDDLFITNYHCATDCEEMQFTLGYQPEIPANQRQTFFCKELVHKNETYDYALYQVEPAPDNGQSQSQDLGFKTLKLSTAPLLLGEKVVIIGHPGTGYKEIDRSDSCVISSIDVFTTDTGRQTIKHMCDTDGGSSGSPLLNRASGDVVALHWGGKDDEYNEAVPIYLIVEDLKASLPTDLFTKLAVSYAEHDIAGN